MNGKPTIEERMTRASFAPPPGDTPAIDLDDAARIAREYAAERTAPLVVALEDARDVVFRISKFSPGFEAWIASADAVLAAEKEARA